MTEQPATAEEKLRAALIALGLGDPRSPDPDRQMSQAFLSGALLALADQAAEEPHPDTALGYRWALTALAHDDTAAAQRQWALLAIKRLQLIAAGLRGHTGNSRPVAAVAGPAALAAANILSVLRDRPPTSDSIAEATDATTVNLGQAQENMAVLRTLIRDDFQL